MRVRLHSSLDIVCVGDMTNPQERQQIRLEIQELQL